MNMNDDHEERLAALERKLSDDARAYNAHIARYHQPAQIVQQPLGGFGQSRPVNGTGATTADKPQYVQRKDDCREWEPADKPTVAASDPQYRMLEVGEVIREGDEWRSLNGNWIDTGSIGRKIFLLDRPYYRRRIVPNDKPVQESAVGDPYKDESYWQHECARLRAELAANNAAWSEDCEKLAKVTGEQDALKADWHIDAYIKHMDSAQKEIATLKAAFKIAEELNGKLRDFHSCFHLDYPLGIRTISCHPYEQDTLDKWLAAKKEGEAFKPLEQVRRDAV